MSLERQGYSETMTHLNGLSDRYVSRQIATPIRTGLSPYSFEGEVIRSGQGIRERENSVRDRERYVSDRIQQINIQQSNLDTRETKLEEKLASLKEVVPTERLKQCIKAYEEKLSTLRVIYDQEYEKRMKGERKTKEKEKRIHGAERVAEALSKRNKEIEAEVEQRVRVEVERRVKEEELKRINDHEASTAIDVVVRTELENKKKHDLKELDTRMRTLTGTVKPSRLPSLTCSYCKENEVSMIFLPCCHLATCVNCAPSTWFAMERKCLLCKVEIEDCKRLYF